MPQSPTPKTPISAVSALRMSFRRSHIRRRPRLFGEPKSAVTVPEPQNAPKSALDQTHGWLSANSMWAVKGMKKLGESAESESVQLRARRAILQDLIGLRKRLQWLASGSDRAGRWRSGRRHDGCASRRHPRRPARGSVRPRPNSPRSTLRGFSKVALPAARAIKSTVGSPQRPPCSRPQKPDVARNGIKRIPVLIPVRT